MYGAMNGVVVGVVVDPAGVVHELPDRDLRAVRNDAWSHFSSVSSIVSAPSLASWRMTVAVYDLVTPPMRVGSFGRIAVAGSRLLSPLTSRTVWLPVRTSTGAR